MIVTDIKNISSVNPKLGKLIDKALEFEKLGKNGKYSLQGNDITATVSEDHLEEQSKRSLELHHEFADVQIVVKGKERYGYMIGSFEGKLETDRLESDDLAFLPLEQECQYTDLEQNQLVVFLPKTPHKPLCIPSTENKIVKKVIIKIRKNLLTEYFGFGGGTETHD